MALLIAGGYDDLNLSVLADAAGRANLECFDTRIPTAESPSFSWNPGGGPPRFSDREIKVAGAFIRHDVFSGMKDPRPQVAVRAFAWHQAIMGWLLSDPRIRIFNRHISLIASNKPAVLVLAQQEGLRIPPTMITNETSRFEPEEVRHKIAKPVGGGDFCYSLEEALAKTNPRDGLTASPAIVQKRLVAPEVRIYVIGQSTFAFEVRSESLDYRVKQDARLVLLADVPPEAHRLRNLMARMNMDFGAADFKTDPDTGHLIFLELNTSPMFAQFDQISGGQISDAMVGELMAGELIRS
ncbi:MAG TPA: hypothetical protein VKZ53_19000 [Candidatus Angelobacter sp.]|nr:hypothetical protein [Candidatus Angelobacter sp.]